MFIAFAVLGIAAPQAFAAPGFQPALDANLEQNTSETRYGSGFLPDGSFALLAAAAGSTGGTTTAPYLATHPVVTSAAAPFDAPVRLGGAVTAASADYAVDADGNAVAAWRAYGMPGATATFSIVATVRLAGGTWSEPTIVSPTAQNSYDPRVQVHGGRTVVAFSTHADVAGSGSPEQLVHAVQGTVGGAWTVPVRLGTLAEPDMTERVTDLVSDPLGAFWVVFTDHRPVGVTGGDALWMRRLPAASSAWDDLERIDQDLTVNGGGTVQESPGLVFGADGDGLITWGGYGKVDVGDTDHLLVLVKGCAASTGACAPGPGTPVSASAPTQDSNPDVAVDSQGRFAIVWSRSNNGGGLSAVIRFREADGDLSLIHPVSNEVGIQDVRVATTALDTLVMSWTRNGATGFQSIEASTLETGTTTWAAPARLSDDSQTAIESQVVVDDEGNAAVHWQRGGRVQVAPYDVAAPRATSLVVPTQVTVGASLALSVRPTDVWSAVTGIAWSVDGASIGSGADRATTLATPGMHTVSLTLSDSAGNQRSLSRQVQAVPPVTPTDPVVVPSVDPKPIDPKPDVTPPPAYVLTDTTSVDAMPAVVGLDATQARDRIDRAGIQADFSIKLVNRATPPRGIGLGEVMAQKPAAGTQLTTAMRDQEPVELQLYAGPANLDGTKQGCSSIRVASAIKGLELDLARLLLRSMECSFRLDVTGGGGNDAAVTGVTQAGGKLTVGTTVPRDPKRNDLFLIFRENSTAMSFERTDWSLTAGQRNSFTVQVVDRSFRLAQKANLTFDLGSVGAIENVNGQSNAQGEQTVILNPARAGVIDVLVELPGADGDSIWGYAQVKVSDRSRVKVGTQLGTVSGRVFRKAASGQWLVVPGGQLADGRTARFINFGGILSWMQKLVEPMGAAVKQAFAVKSSSPEQTLRAALANVKVAPGQLALSTPLVSGNIRIADVIGAPVVAAGGGNVVAAGGGNVVAPGGGNVIAAGGGNVVAAGGGNVIAAGGGNIILASGSGVVAAGGGNVVAAGGGNVIAAGGGSVVAAGGGNLMVNCAVTHVPALQRAGPGSGGVLSQ